MTEKEQLLPCPFCGEDNEHFEHIKLREEIGMKPSWVVWHYCDDDGYVGHKANTKQEVINKWNTRAISADEANNRIAELERERDHWKANHKCEVDRARVLKERIDMPLERVQAYEQISEMKEQIRRLKAFVNALLDDEDFICSASTTNKLTHHGIVDDKSYKKADWVKNENE